MLVENAIYYNDIKKVADSHLNWEKLKKKNILIAGATGMVGHALIDVLMYRNETYGDKCKVIALGRNMERAREIFGPYFENNLFHFVSCDINNEKLDLKNIDYIIHGASNTHPLMYAKEPVNTILTNVLGTKNLLDLAVENQTKRFVFLSSVEVYGENRGDTEKFSEAYCGYLNCNTLRAGYPEGKRLGEALCQAYIAEHNLDIVIPRLSRIYGPTMLWNDSKAISQFIKNGVNSEDIVLKSEGNQLYSYTYVVDAAKAILALLLEGEKGEAYNVSDENSEITLKDLAEHIACYAGKKVIFQLPEESERKGYSTATKALLNVEKIRTIGWNPDTEIKQGIEKTINVLKWKADK
ncbi:MAG: NAD-dependent epimerase/dehydratase family protein [Lachnospiraceae bacterium]|nr:NAD-dependent epimerase/dehydratase family protein [Lachnospiraceae bacterium]